MLAQCLRRIEIETALGHCVVFTKTINGDSITVRWCELASSDRYE